MPPDTPLLIDSHLHLQDPVFEEDLQAVIARARDAGARVMVCNSTSERDWERVARLAETVPGVVPCFGVHPWYLKNRSADWPDRLTDMLRSLPSAVGEAGLDRWRDDRDDAEQEEVFRAQLCVARTLGRPIMVHCLKAWGWLMRVLDDEPPPPAGMLLHAYGGPVELMAVLAEKGAYFSFAGNVLDERKSRMRAALQAAPLDRLMLETDSPDLPPPEGFRVASGRTAGERYRNEPANLGKIAPAVADLRGMKLTDLAQKLTDNARRLLGPVPHSSRLFPSLPTTEGGHG
jgi:TatD DNase family protein